MEDDIKQLRRKAIQDIRDSNKQTTDQPYGVVSDVGLSFTVGSKLGEEIRINEHCLDIKSDDEIVCTDCEESFEIPELIQNTAPHRTVAYRLYLIGKFTDIDCNRQLHEFDQLDRNSRPEAPDWAKTYTSNSPKDGSLMMNEGASTSPNFKVDFSKFDVDVSDKKIEKFKQIMGDNDSTEAPVKKFMRDSDESGYL